MTKVTNASHLSISFKNSQQNITNLSGNLWVVEEVDSLSALFSSAGEGLMMDIKDCSWNVQSFAATEHTLVPILVICEDGVTITDGTEDNGTLQELLDAAIDKSFEYKILGIQHGIFKLDGATYDQLSSRTYDLTPFARKIAKRAWSSIEDEVDVHTLIAFRIDDNGTNVTVRNKTTYQYDIKQRPLRL